jgi:hypothetical protein
VNIVAALRIMGTWLIALPIHVSTITQYAVQVYALDIIMYLLTGNLNSIQTSFQPYLLVYSGLINFDNK